MTYRYSGAEWLDVLYTAVRKTQGGVADAARFLTERRGKSIHQESLRAKLRGLEGESLTLEIAELLTEWMEEKRQPDAKDWLIALNAQHGLRVVPVEEPTQDNGAIEIMMSFLKYGEKNGDLSQTLSKILDDGVVTKQEKDEANKLAMTMFTALNDIITKINGAAK